MHTFFQVVIKAATTLATTVAVVGAGAAGAAVYCNARGVARSPPIGT